MRDLLRPYQSEALAKVRGALLENATRIMLQAPAGAGKTVLAASMVEDQIAFGNRVAFVVSDLSLIDQTIAAFNAQGIADIGIIQADHPGWKPNAVVQICSIQTLSRRGAPKVDFVIVDEAHKRHKAHEDWFSCPETAAIPVIGLTATPWRKGLGRHFQKLIKVTSTAKLIEEKYLSPFKAYAPAHPDLTGVKTVAGDYHEGQLSAAMNQSALVADIVTTWKEKADNRPTFCFCVDRAHAMAVKIQFEKAGIPAGYLDCFADRLERLEVKQAFHTSEIKIVCNVGILTTGIDWDVRCIIMALPTKSEMLFVQIIGRGLRTAEGKTDCLILDHSDNHLRLGFVTDINHDSLDVGQDARKVADHPGALPKECLSCHYLRPPKVHVCPACGFAPEVKSKIQCDDGELVEISNRRELRLAQSDFYSQLLWIANEKGY